MNLLKGLFGGGCSHRFTWPRTDAHGRLYQICPLCGTAYEYDWSTMRRTDRLMASTIPCRSMAAINTAVRPQNQISPR